MHDVGWAREMMEAGHRVCKAGWAPDKYWFVVDPSALFTDAPTRSLIYSSERVTTPIEHISVEDARSEKWELWQPDPQEQQYRANALAKELAAELASEHPES